MSENEDNKEPEEEEVEWIDKTRFTNSFLLKLLNDLSLSIIQKKASVKCDQYDFIISIEDELINDWSVSKGNPVVIRVQTAYVLKQMIKQSSIHVLAEGLQLALEVVHKMRHTLSVEPVANVLWRTEEMRRWRKAASDRALYTDKIIPDKEITYTETVTITAVHKGTGLSARLTERIHKANPQVMRISLRKTLSDMVKDAPKRDKLIRVTDDPVDFVGYRSERTWSAIPSGFEGNESASRWICGD